MFQAIIGVDETSVETAIKQVFMKNADGRVVQRGEMVEVLTHTHLESLASCAGETLMERGRVTFRDLASTFKLPVDVSARAIVSRIISVGSSEVVWHLGSLSVLSPISISLVTSDGATVIFLHPNRRMQRFQW